MIKNMLPDEKTHFLNKVVQNIGTQTTDIIKVQIGACKGLSVEKKDLVLQGIIETFSFELGRLLTMAGKVGMDRGFITNKISGSIRAGADITKENWEKFVENDIVPISGTNNLN